MVEGKGAKCFIATAAYGSEFEDNVLCLRRFRDERLTTTVLGRAFIRLYNKLGPIVAMYISSRSKGRSFTRALLLPIVKVINRSN